MIKVNLSIKSKDEKNVSLCKYIIINSIHVNQDCGETKFTVLSRKLQLFMIIAGIMEQNDELRNKLWFLLQQSRKTYKVRDFDFFEKWITSAKTEQLGERLTVWNSVLKNNFNENYGELITKPKVAAFVCQLINSDSYSRILDPACGTGYLLSEVAASCGAREVDGIEINQKICETAMKLHENLDIQNSNSFRPICFMTRD